MKICFIIGSPDISGGTYVIFQHALYLKLNMGFNVDIISMVLPTEQNTKWHPEANLHLIFKSFENVAGNQYDIAIITWWKTAYEANKINAKRYIYFVQSIESFFYPKNEIPLRKLVDSTYTCNLPVITEATWIKNYLYYNYGSEVWLVKNGIRKDIYKPYGTVIEEKKKNKLRVLIEGPVDVDFKNVPKTVALCKKSMADEVWLLTSSTINFFSGADRVFSRVSINETAEIYRSCDVLIKLSYVEGMFGPPLEMFHCGGTAIVYNVTGHDEYIHHKINGLVVGKENDQLVVEYINLLKRDYDLLLQLKREALLTAFDWPDWSTSSKAFYHAVLDIIKSTPEADKNYFFKRSKENFNQYVEEENIAKAIAKK